jgi:choline dehydrogenase-like flavoprotein
MLSTFYNSPRPTRLIEAGAAGALLNPKKMIGLMVKTTDDRIGKVYQDGSVSKTPTPDDQVRIDAGVQLASTILIQAGADPKSILVTQVQGAHPGGTAAIGEIVDENLQTDIDNLFICDASVLPETPGLPPILTLLALARFLAGKLVLM